MAYIIGGSTPSVAFQYSEVGLGPVATYSFLAVPLGTAAPRRRMVLIGTTSAAAITGATVAGSAMTRLTSTPNDDSFIVDMPTGTSATVTLTKSSAVNALVSVTLWAVYDLASPLLRTVSHSTASPGVLDLDVSSRAVVLALSRNSTAGVTRVWTGATQDYIQTATLNQVNRSAASIVTAAAETPRTVRVAYSGGAGFVATAISLR